MGSRRSRGLSERQQRIVQYVRQYTEEHGYPPSIREIGQAVGISSTSVVDYNLSQLVQKGIIRRDREVSRGIGLVGESLRLGRQPAPAAVRVPVAGRIAAGQPIEAIQGDSEFVDIPASMATEGCFALQVKGRSMVEDCIDDGDLVVVRPQDTANDGEIVVALITDSANPEGIATLKRLYREKGRVRLQPANSEMQPIYVDPRYLRVQGKVVGVIRQY